MSDAPSSRVCLPALDLLLLLFSLSLVLQPLVEPDFGWHLRTGLDLLTQGLRVPATDPYSHTLPEWPWVEHAWLTDVVIALVYRGGGAAGALGVILLFAAVTGAAFAVAAASARAGRTCRLAALALALWTAWPFLGARTQMITLLGVAVVLRLCERYRVGALAHLWMVPPLFLLWANLHGGFTAGLFVAGLILAGATVLGLAAARPPTSQWLRPGGTPDEPVPGWPLIRHLALVLAVSALVTLINPYGWRLHQEIASSLTDRFMTETLREWQPVSLESRAGRWYLGYVALLAAGMLALYRRHEPLRWLILGVFLVLSVRHWRNVPFFLLISVPLWAELLSDLVSRLGSRLTIRVHHAKRWLLAGAVAAALTLVILGPDHLRSAFHCGLSPADYFRGTDYPIEAVDWIRTHRDQVGTHLYNDYGMGGFLLWWLPNEKIFIDGRMPAWRIGDRWIFYDYVALTAWDPPEVRVLAKYAVDWAIVTQGTPLEQALATGTGWQDVYRDRKVTVFVKQHAAR